MDGLTIPDNNDPELVAGTAELLNSYLHPLMRHFAERYPAALVNRALIAALSNMLASSVVQYGQPSDLEKLTDWATDTLRKETGAAYTYMSTEGATKQ